jgi:hypothetical protein
MADVKDPQKLTDKIAEQENKEDLAAMEKYVVEPVKKLGKRLYENVMGTEKQNKAAKESLKKAGKFAKGGKVNSASSRGDGIAQRGKTRGKIC